MTEPVAATPSGQPRHTPLYDSHVALGGKIIDFGGWAMPLQYGAGILAEHRAVRTDVGLFDVSHMGEVTFNGPRAAEAVQRLVTADISTLEDGRAVYCVACLPSGGMVDDLIVYRATATSYLIVINAANIKKDIAWFVQEAGDFCEIKDISDETGLISIQGPRAFQLMVELTDPALADLPSFAWRHARIDNVDVQIARTGYTGEDGFELFSPASQTARLWDLLLQRGRPHQVLPIGLGARDTLRLEAKLSLYGNDLDEEHTPHEAGLSRVVRGNGFIGQDALAAQKAAGVQRKLVGFVMRDRFVARHGYEIINEHGTRMGPVTSGAPGPTIGQNIGLAYVPVESSAVGTRIIVAGRGKTGSAEIVQGAFYPRAKMSGIHARSEA